jgi:hypothetical protein
MPTQSALRANSREGGRGNRPLVQRNTSVAASRLVATAKLMACGDNLSLPRLDRVPVEHSLCAGDEPAVALAKTLLKLDIAVPEDWEKAKHDPTAYIGLTLARWIASHGVEAIKRRFDLTTAITSLLDDYTDRDPVNPNLLYLTVDASSAGYVVLSSTLELLEKAHLRLPATFFHLFTGAPNKWIRIYDYRDAEERVAMMREWIEGEPDEDQYEIPDVGGCIPASMKRRPLGRRSLREVRSRVKGREAKLLLKGVIELAGLSEQADRPELTNEMREEMGDMNSPLPGVLAVFKSDDAIEGCFDEEAQSMMEVTPEPSLIIPLSADQPASVEAAFRTLGVVCDTLAAASRLVDLMPGNDQWVIQGGKDGSASADRR